MQGKKTALTNTRWTKTSPFIMRLSFYLLLAEQINLLVSLLGGVEKRRA